MPEKKTIAQQLIYLLACGCNDCKPDAKQICADDLEKIYRLAKFHSLAAMTYMVLENTALLDECNAETHNKWKESKEKAIRKTMLMDAERASILQQFDAEGIWYVPLKGVYLKNLYPRFGMREMSDNDILIDAACQKRVQKMMLARGYDGESLDKIHHDAFHKKPIYNFEMHHTLFDEMGTPEWENYYRNVKERLLPDRNGTMEFHFTDEDFYLYVTAHNAKHYRGSGSGLRMLVDSFFYCREKGEQLNWEYIQREAKVLGLSEFEETSRTLAKKLFSDPQSETPPEFNQAECEMLQYVVGSGTYGTLEHNVENKLKKITKETAGGNIKWNYIKKRLWLDRETMERLYPLCKKYPWTLFLCRIYRLVRGLIRNSKRIATEIKILQKTK